MEVPNLVIRKENIFRYFSRLNNFQKCSYRRKFSAGDNYRLGMGVQHAPPFKWIRLHPLTSVIQSFRRSTYIFLPTFLRYIKAAKAYQTYRVVYQTARYLRSTGESSEVPTSILTSYILLGMCQR